ncbi:MAG TPA: hypothetical protein DCF68_08460 [Cyanothece sp. UBA12306]|nr:hypothetical protein [Cyanothece sp. UBA12306]
MINPFGVGTPITGFTQVDGFAEVNPPRGGAAIAQAASAISLAVQYRTQAPNGQIIWGPRITDTIGAGASAFQRRIRDPISFEVTDIDTGNSIVHLLITQEPYC